MVRSSMLYLHHTGEVQVQVSPYRAVVHSCMWNALSTTQSLWLVRPYQPGLCDLPRVRYLYTNTPSSHAASCSSH